MRLRLEIAGAEATVRELRGLGERLARPPRSLFEAVGQEWKALFRANVAQERLGAFAPLAPLTLKHRQQQGYRSGPPLLRSGSLLNSLDVLAAGDGFVEVGPRDDTGRASFLHHGGRTSPRSRHPNRPVPPRPYVRLSEEDVELTLEAFIETLLEERPA